MSFRGSGRKVYHKSRESYQQQTLNRGRFARSHDPVPREDCYDDNVYEVENILLDNVDPMRPDSFPRFTPINKKMYLGFTSKCTVKTAVAAVVTLSSGCSPSTRVAVLESKRELLESKRELVILKTSSLQVWQLL